MAEKSRYFMFITYETDLQKLSDALIAEGGDYLVSPLHNPDEDNKKPHYHVMYFHGNTVSEKAVRKIIPGELPANGVILPVHHPNNMQRYFLHLDSPEKQQFPQDSYTVINQFPVDFSKRISKEEWKMVSKQILTFIKEYSITEYAELIDALCVLEDETMYLHAVSHTIFLSRYLDSKRYSGKKTSSEGN